MQLCREIFGTDDRDALRRIAEKAEKYDLILQTSRPGNLRGAGRKARYGSGEIRRMCEMYEAGCSVREIAGAFQTSRQTVYKYLALGREAQRAGVTLRINFMEEYTVCSVIDVDEDRRKVWVSNRVADYSRCAFGALEQPGWDAYEWFLESRCFPRDDPQAQERLAQLGLEQYDPMEILRRTKGRLERDRHWLQIIAYDREAMRGEASAASFEVEEPETDGSRGVEADGEQEPEACRGREAEAGGTQEPEENGERDRG